MATTTTNSKKDVKGKKMVRTSYITNALKRKDLLLWIPPEMDQDSQIGMVVSYLQYVENIKPLDLLLYDNDFTNFYGMEIQQKYDDTVKDGYHFCSNKTSGVNEGYIIDSVNDPTTATIMSVKLNPDDSFDEIYALVTFTINDKKHAIKIHTLCGNQVLPPSGEGTRLMKLIERIGDKLGYNKIILNPLDSAIPFYSDNKYRHLTERDSNESSSSYETASSEDGPKLVMQKNIKALKGWAKIKTATRTIGMLKKRRAVNERLQLEKKYTQKAMEKEASRPIKLDLRTMRERSTKIVPGASFANTTKFVPKPKPGMPSKLIVPGESFVISNKKAEILNAADTSRRKEVNEIIARLESEKVKQKTSKNKTGKGNKKKTRKN
jgi:hypothetical protein